MDLATLRRQHETLVNIMELASTMDAHEPANYERMCAATRDMLAKSYERIAATRPIEPDEARWKVRVLNSEQAAHFLGHEHANALDRARNECAEPKVG